MDVRLLIGLVALIGLASAAWGSDVREYTLARDGKPTISIIVPKGADPVITTAADDLATYIEKASGARPDVDLEGAPTAECAIYLGETDACRDAGLPPSGMKDEGYAIVPREGNILICGSTDYGTANGVYGFLQDVMGVRWFMPGEMWEVVPKADPLVVKVTGVRSEPDFSYRIWSGLVGQDGPLWGTRNRLTRDRKSARYFGFGHNLSRIIPPSKYGEEHPEYFPEINGKRFVPDTDSVAVGQICFTNPDAIALTVKAAQDYFDENPDASQFSLCINDNASMCTCENCSALDEPYRMHRTGRQYSDSYFHYVTEVAKELAKTHPDKTVGCYAYWPVELPPRHIERLPDNVVIALTQDTSQQFDPEYRARDRELWLQWTKVASHVGKYDYYGLGWYTPRYFPHLAADDLKFLHEAGVTGLYCETYPYWIMTAPQLYMAAQLLWDVEQDPDALLNEYIETLYGDAAPTMKEFYSLLERIWQKERPGRWFQGLDWIGNELINFDAKRMTEAKSLLDKAFDESSGIERERVAYVRDFFRFSYTIVAGYDCAQSLKSLPLRTRDDVDRLVREIGRTVSMSGLAQRMYSLTLKQDPLHKHSYYADAERFWRKFGSWEQTLTGPAVAQVIRLHNWAQSNLQPNEVEDLLEDIDAAFSKAGLRNPVDHRAPLAPAMEIGSAPVGLKIDGDLSDWGDIEWTKMDIRESESVTGLDAEFALALGKDALYLACKVHNEKHIQATPDAGMWQQDSLQIALDPLRNAWETVSYGPDDREYGFALSEKGTASWCWQGPKPGLASLPFAVVRDEGTTVYEVAIPWKEIGFAKAPLNRILGLSLLVNDDDGSGRRWVSWGRGINERKDPRLFMPVRLAE